MLQLMKFDGGFRASESNDNKRFLLLKDLS